MCVCVSACTVLLSRPCVCAAAMTTLYSMSDHVFSSKVNGNKRSPQPRESTPPALSLRALISEDSCRGPLGPWGICSLCLLPSPLGGLLCTGTSAAPSRLALQSRALVPLSVGCRSSRKGKADTDWENLGSPGFRPDRVGMSEANLSLLRSG